MKIYIFKKVKTASTVKKGVRKMIKLSKIIEALEDVDANMSAYYNTKTNEILWQNGIEPEYSTYKKRTNLMMKLSLCLILLLKMIMILCFSLFIR